MILPFFYLANIYRPGLGKVQLDRPNSKLIQPLNFYLRKKGKTHSTQNCMHNNGLDTDFQFWFSFIFKKYYQFFLPIYIIIIHNFFFKSVSNPVLVSLCWCQHNLFHCIAMENECLNRFWNFKNPTSGKMHFNNIFTMKMN